MFELRRKLFFVFSLFSIALLMGCEQATDDGGMTATVPQSTDGTRGQVVVGSQDTPRLRGTGDTRFRATWDGRTVILDIRDENGIIPATIGVNATVKIRVPKDERDRFEDETDEDNTLPPNTLLASFDAESNVYVAQIPSFMTIPNNRKVKVKVAATNFKTANGKVVLDTDSPTYVGVLLRAKKSGGGKSTVGAETLDAINVSSPSLQIEPDQTVNLNVSGTLSSGTNIVNPPADVSIAPAGAVVTVDLNDGSYDFTAFSEGTYLVTFSDGAATATVEIAVALPEPPGPPITGYRTGTADGWANNVAAFLDHIDATDNGFYDGGWNVAFATVESESAQGGIGNPSFGQGVVVGSPQQFYLYLTDGVWATEYLRAPGGTAGALTETQGNGVAETSSGDFGHQVLALKFNVDFSNPPSGSAVPAGRYLPSGFGALKLKETGTTLDGSTIGQILAQANVAVGGGALPTDYTYASFNQLLVSLNGSFTTGSSSNWATRHLEVVPGGGDEEPPEEPPAPPITGYRTGTVDGWAYNVAGFLSNIDATENGFYDGGWNVAFATVESEAAQGGIGDPSFGQGVVVGSPNQFYLYLSDGYWATEYLRGPSGPPGALLATQGNGVGDTNSGEFGHQVLALKFNLDFSNPPSGSTVEPGHYLPAGFGELRLKTTGGSLDGSTVAEVLAAANQALGGGALPDGYTFASLNGLVTNLNASFETGTGTGWANNHLEVPEAPPTPLTGFRTGNLDAWANNVASILDHIDATDNGFYDGGWNVAFATIYSSETGGGIGDPAFGQGVVVGSIFHQYHIYLTDMIWATTLLRGPSDPPGALTANHGNGVSSTPAGELAQQALVLKMNIDFSNPPEGSTRADGYYMPAGFGALRLRHMGDSSLDNLSMREVLGMANQALSGGVLPADYTYESINELLKDINGSFEGGVASTWGAVHMGPEVLPGYRTGTLEDWMSNLSGFLSNIGSTNNGFYDGGWNVAFATVESSAAGGGIGNPSFGQGVVIGSPDQFYIYLTDAVWATTYLQGEGGTPGALTATHGNGVTVTGAGDFGKQVLTLKFNVDFSNPPAGSTVAPGYYLPTGFGALKLKDSGTSLDGQTVAQILAAANQAMGGGPLPSDYTYESFHALLRALNGAFDGGEASGWAAWNLEE